MTVPARSLRMPRFSAIIWLAIIYLSVVVVCALFADHLAVAPQLAISGEPYTWPSFSWPHPLGTDVMGRDILSEIIYGARTSLVIGLGATAVTLAAGIFLGAVGGYYGGWVDILVLRLIEIIQTLPTLIFAIVVIAVFNASTLLVIVVLGINNWPTIARLVRAETKRLREAEFVQAARTFGMRSDRVLLTHVVPNALASTLAISAVMIANAILGESTLSFLGLGDPNATSWGGMIASGKDALRSGWYIATIPGLVIVATVASFSVLRTVLYERLSPRQGGQS